MGIIDFVYVLVNISAQFIPSNIGDDTAGLPDDGLPDDPQAGVSNDLILVFLLSRHMTKDNFQILAKSRWKYPGAW